MAVPVQHVIESVQEASYKPERLVLLVGGPGSGKSKILRELSTIRGWKYVDTRSLITDEILELAPKARPQQAPHLMAEALEELNGEVILLDGIEVLFAPVLNIEPLALIRQISRKHTLVVGWPGSFADGRLAVDYDGKRTDYAATVDTITIITIG